MRMAPQPHKTIRCQQVLKDGHCTHSGWLRKQSIAHQKIAAINKILPWANKYVVLSQGCVYVYGSDTSSNPKHPFSLHGYDKVVQAGDILQRDVPWPFKLLPVETKGGAPNTLKTRYFSAGSEREQKKWMFEFKKQMMFANGKGLKVSHNYSGDGSVVSLTIVQESVYTDACDYHPATESHHNSDSDDDQEYNEIDDWKIGNGAEEQDPRSSKRGPLPLPPQQDEKPERVRTSRSVDASSRPPPPLPSPVSTKSSNSFSSPLPSPSQPLTPPVPVPRHRMLSIPNDLPDDSPPPTPNPGSEGKVEGDIRSRIAALNNRPVPPNKPHWGAVKLLPTANNNSGTPKWAINAVKTLPTPDPTSPTSKTATSLSDRRPPPLPPSYSTQEQTVAEADDSEETFINSIHMPGIAKEHAASYVSEAGEEGVYLLRDGTAPDCDYVLAVFAEGMARKYKVSKDASQVYLEKEKKFASIRSLVQYYEENTIPLRTRTRLTRPYKS